MAKKTSSKNNISKKILDIQSKIQQLQTELSEIMPYAIVKETSAFGNSAHIVLSKELLDKKVGVVLLNDSNSIKNGKKL